VQLVKAEAWLRCRLPEPVTPMIASLRRRARDIRFRVRYGFRRPPYGTDLIGYELVLDFLSETSIFELDGDLVEIGAFLGGGTYKLAKYAALRSPEKKLYTIDVFDPKMDGTLNISGDAMSDLYLRSLRGRTQWDVFHDITRNLNNLTVIKGDSAAVDLPCANVCFALIDGNHDPWYVKNDFYLVWHNLVPGGAVAFDDYGYDLPDVTATINKLIGEHSKALTVAALKGKIIFLKRNSSACAA